VHTRVAGKILFLVAAALAARAQEDFASPPTIGESPHLELAPPAGYTPAEARALRVQFDAIFEVVAERLGVSLDERVTVALVAPAPGPCRSRGWTMVPQRRSENDPLPKIFIFADRSTDMKQISAGFAHELGHVLEYVALNDQSIHTMFLEGFATWAAGPFWLEWQGAASFQSAAASYLAAGTYVPLHENEAYLDTLSEAAAARLGDDCLRRRDVIYTEWAAFIEHLVAEHGRERLYSLFRTPPLESEDGTRFRRPNFPAVYGNSLERLESAWLERLSRRP
jgi:hypothetical protein